jgi:hypothetical protein
VKAEEQKAQSKSRRRGSENRKKTIPVTSRYDETEFAELDAAASRAGLSRAGYQRTQSLTSPRTRSVRRAPVEKEELARILGQLGKIGSNLNQLARAFNRDRSETEQIGATLAELRDLVPAIRLALGLKS